MEKLEAMNRSLATMMTTDMMPANNSWKHITDAPSSITDSPPSIPSLASRLFNYKAAWLLHRYWLPVTIFVGLIGNIISFIIMLKPHNKKISCCNYMAALAITDSFILLTALDYWSLTFDARPTNNIECRVMVWLFQGSSFSSMIFIFSMTADRFIAVKFPFRARTLCSAYRSRVAISCITVFTLLYTLPYLFTSGIIPGSRTCVGVLTKDQLSSIYNWANIFLGSFVPFVGLLAMNAIIIVTIRTRSKYFQKSEESMSSRSKNGTKNKGLQPDPITESSSVEFSDISPSLAITNPETTNATSSQVSSSATDPTSVSSSRALAMLGANPANADPTNATSKASQSHITNSFKAAGTISENGSTHPALQSRTSANGLKVSKKTPENGTQKALQLQSRTSTNSIKAPGKTSEDSSSSDNQLTVMLLLVTFTFLLLTLPQYVRYLVAVLWDYRASAHAFADYTLFAHVSNKVFYVNSACNFFLYCLSGSRFRKDLMSLFVCKK